MKKIHNAGYPAPRNDAPIVGFAEIVLEVADEIDTNFHMIDKLLKVYHPECRGMLTGDEVALVTKVLHLEEMDNVQLRNLRDFVVSTCDWTVRTDGKETMDLDRMSAITCVIDGILFSIGEEV